MSKRTKTRQYHANPTTEKRRRQTKATGSYLGFYSKKKETRDFAFYSALLTLKQDFCVANVIAAAKLGQGITKASVIVRHHNPPTKLTLVVSGREGVCPHWETVRGLRCMLEPYLPPDVELLVVGNRKSKGFQLLNQI